MNADQPSLREDFLSDVYEGLDGEPKSLPCKYFYDETGSQLFECICTLEEYYLTRTELAIMREKAAEMASAIGTRSLLVELGSGSSTKTCLLIDRLEKPAAYVPVDIATEQLHASAGKISAAYPRLQVLPVNADYTFPFQIPSPSEARRIVVYFPGSTIGNFKPAEAVQFLGRIARAAAVGGGLLVGIDLVKDRETLEKAYNDALGVTSAFNRNLLRRINRELNGDFPLEKFEHLAQYNERAQRMEIFLRCTEDHPVRIGDRTFHFREGECINTEYSYKYTVPDFAQMAAEAGFILNNTWTDPDEHFAVLFLEVGTITI